MSIEAEHVKTIGDALSVSMIGATLAGWLPAIAALISIIWGCIRIYETKTVQALLGNDPDDDL